MYLLYPGIIYLPSLKRASVSLSLSLSLWKLIYNFLRSFSSVVTLLSIFFLKCILTFVDIAIHPIIDVKFRYFIFLDKGRYLLLTSIELNLLLLSLVLTLLPRLALTVFQILSMLLLVTLLSSFISRLDISISLRT